jgi:hypothetical protein
MITDNTDSIGIDIGGVIIDRINDKTDTSFFGENYLSTTPVPDAIESIKRLVDERFGLNAYVVSKAGLKTEKRSREWLKYHNFYKITGIAEDRIIFCRERSEKAAICIKHNITHFVDDRLEVLSYLKSVPHKFLFKGGGRDLERHKEFLPLVCMVESWAEVLQKISKGV